jgi:hypothetical protein
VTSIQALVATQGKEREEYLMSEARAPLVLSMDETLHWLLSLTNHGPLQCTSQCQNLQNQSELNKLPTDHQSRD